MSGTSVAEDELTGSRCFDGNDDVDDDVDELELWQSSWEDGDGDVGIHWNIGMNVDGDILGSRGWRWIF